MGYINEACAHMNTKRKSDKVPAGYWDIKENFLNDVKKYNNKREWRTNSKVAYQKASNNGWLNEIKRQESKLKNTLTNG